MFLSKPSTKIAREYDVVVIGSGYGGSVAACRLSRSGLKVAVFELGIEHSSDDYAKVGGTSFVSKTRIHYNNLSFGPKYSSSWVLTITDDCTIVAGQGLGGGSIINAAVMLEPERRVFEDERWPKAVQSDFESGRMDEYYQRAKDMLQVSEYPSDYKAPKVEKSELFRKAAEGAGWGHRISKPPLAVSFEAKASNHVGVPQPATDYSGDSLQGNRSGAKNDMTKNYLPAALASGAQIFCGIDVRWIEENPQTGMYTVVFKDASQSPEAEFSVTAPQVVLAAGTLGSAAIMLRSKEKRLLDVNDNIGKRFTGNGATVAFVEAGPNEKAVKLYSTGAGDTAGQLGVFIDTVLDLREPDAPDISSNVVLEDCVWSMMLGPSQLGTLDFPDSWKDFAKMARTLVGEKSPTLPLMVLGHDDADAEIYMSGKDEDKERHPLVHWKSTEKENMTRESQRKAYAELAKALGGTWKELPPFARSVSKRCTAHPMGGLVMSDDPNDGVVDGSCHLYRKDGSTHEGLMIVDGSTMPTSTGCNPALTITALAERAIDQHINRTGKRLSLAFRRKSRHSRFLMGLMSPEAPNVEFSERMKGHVAISGSRAVGAEGGFKAGKASNSTFEFSAKITIDDLGCFMDHIQDATVFGTARMPSISPYPMTITSGTVKLFEEDEQDVFTRTMQYELPLQARNGNLYTLMGVKKMTNEHGINCFAACGQAYHDTTTMQVILYEGEAGGKIMGQGMLYISLSDVTKMLFSFKGTEASRFKQYFMSNLSQIYLSAFRAKKTPTFMDQLTPLKRKLASPSVRTYWVETKDGEELPLKRYKGGSRGVIICTHGLTASDLVFSIDTIPKNYVELFSELGYDVWTACLRYGRHVEVKREYNLEDVAQYDYPAIIDYVTNMTDANTRKGGIHMHAQGVGAITFCMSVMGGYVAPERIKSLLCNQVGFHFVLPSNSKSKHNIPAMLQSMGIKEYRPPRDPHRKASDKLIDFFASYLVPIPKTFRTDNVEQALVHFVFGETWNPKMMDRVTMERLVADVGVIQISLLQHVILCSKAGKVVNAEGEDVYTPNIHKLAQIPITFQCGSEEKTLSKEGVYLDLQRLQKEGARKGYIAPEGKEMYQVIVAEGHGDLDLLCGKTAHETSFPGMMDHFAKWDNFECRSWNRLPKHLGLLNRGTSVDPKLLRGSNNGTQTNGFQSLV